MIDARKNDRSFIFVNSEGKERKTTDDDIEHYNENIFLDDVTQSRWHEISAKI